VSPVYASGVLKDFFRELPEPLFTNGLYQMLLDAMTVQMADDPHGNAVIMLGIIDCLPSIHQVLGHPSLRWPPASSVKRYVTVWSVRPSVHPSVRQFVSTLCFEPTDL